jgi:hypothetical protein
VQEGASHDERWVMPVTGEGGVNLLRVWWFLKFLSRENVY